MSYPKPPTRGIRTGGRPGYGNVPREEAQVLPIHDHTDDTQGGKLPEKLFGTLAFKNSVTAAEIDNRTRYAWFPAQMFFKGAATAAVVVGTQPDALLSHRMSATALEQLTAGLIQAPADLSASGSVSWDVWWSPSNNNIGNARFRLTVHSLGVGDVVTAAGTAMGWTDVGSTGIPGDTIATTMGTSDPSLVQGKLIRVAFERDGAHANDTFTGTADFLGVSLEYTADS